MGYKKDDVIETYKTLDSSYYIINMDIQEQYRPVLDNINECIVNYIDNPNNIIIPKDTNCLVMLLKHINNNVISKLELRDKISNRYNDIDLLNILWDIYTRICYKLLVKPTILRYCILTNINKCTIVEWEKGNKSNDLFTVSAKKWLSECESTLYDEAINTGNIGCIFALKANYGYRDNYIINVTEQKEEVKSIEEIKQDYNNILPDNNNNIIDF
jgi:hypothetical protein